MHSRVVIGAPASGSGKTTFTCGLLMALKRRGIDVSSFKCGPDYIDPMFHRQIIGSESGNLDLFFATEQQARSIFCRKAREFSVIEGAMGFYDGIGGTTEASAYHLARALEAPVLLVMNPRGMAMSAAAVVKGMAALRKDSRIRGVVLNGCTQAAGAMVKRAIEEECGIFVYGILPKLPECALESRHLGLVTAMEVEDLQKKVELLGRAVEENVDIDGILALGREAPALQAEPVRQTNQKERAVIAVAKDKAFCFYYEENLALLEECGCRLVDFSPLEDKALPQGTAGLYLGGGYPELYAEALSRNEAMRWSIQTAAKAGMPIVGECGGFLYLSQKLDGWPMVGVLPGSCRNTGRLGRFGYIEVFPKRNTVFLRKRESIKAHEFHYWDSDQSGDACRAAKPAGGAAWDCVQTCYNVWAGFPHLYFRSNPNFAERFVEMAERYADEKL